MALPDIEGCTMIRMLVERVVVRVPPLTEAGPNPTRAFNEFLAANPEWRDTYIGQHVSGYLEYQIERPAQLVEFTLPPSDPKPATRKFGPPECKACCALRAAIESPVLCDECARIAKLRDSPWDDLNPPTDFDKKRGA